MLKLRFALPVFTMLLIQTTFGQTTNVDHFDKVIVSPHVEVTFVQGNEESVTVENCTVDKKKINIEVNGKTLRIYLEGAKEITKNKKVSDNGYEGKQSIYNGTVLTATVTYKTMDDLSVRGEETQVCKSPLTGDLFKLKIYGESHVVLTEVNLGELQTTLYGESVLDIKAGRIGHQKYTAYGESKINSLDVTSKTAHITTYGESDFRINTSEKIKITAFGAAKLQYKGNAVVNKGLHFGEMEIAKLD